MSHQPGAPLPPQPGPVPHAGQLRRRPRFWAVIGVVWIVTFGCSAALVGAAEDDADKEPKAAPGPTVTATVTTGPTAKPKPRPTVTVTRTKTETETEKAEVEVTRTVTAPPDGPGGADADVDTDDGTTGGAGSAPYENCAAARADGAAPVERGDPGYGAHLDRDGDGVGCDWG